MVNILTAFCKKKFQTGFLVMQKLLPQVVLSQVTSHSVLFMKRFHTSTKNFLFCHDLNYHEHMPILHLAEEYLRVHILQNMSLS